MHPLWCGKLILRQKNSPKGKKMLINKEKAIESLKKVPIVYAGSEGFVVYQKDMFNAISDLPAEDDYVNWLENKLSTYTSVCECGEWCHNHCGEGQTGPDSECLKHAYEKEKSMKNSYDELMVW